MPTPPPPKHSQFKKGQSGNPKGVPRGTVHFSTTLKRLLSIKEKTSNPITGETENLTQDEIIALAHILKAKSGDMAAIKEIYDRIDGKVTDKLDVTGDMQHEFTVNIVNKPADGR